MLEDIFHSQCMHHYLGENIFLCGNYSMQVNNIQTFLWLHSSLLLHSQFQFISSRSGVPNLWTAGWHLVMANQEPGTRNQAMQASKAPFMHRRDPGSAWNHAPQSAVKLPSPKLVSGTPKVVAAVLDTLSCSFPFLSSNTHPKMYTMKWLKATIH